MRNAALAGVVAIAGAAALALFASFGPSSAEAGSIPCPEPEAKRAFQCRLITVPENHGQPGSRRIQLAVAVGPALSNPGREAVVYITGGPGDPSLDRYPPFLDDLRSRRDVVLVDLRGTGHSRPALMCPELVTPELDLGMDLHAEEYRSQLLDGVRSCRARLGEVADLNAYASADIADDLDAVRAALGYDRWDVIGASYGTRIALALLRDHPGGVRSAILDSAYPPQIDAYVRGPSETVGALDTVLEACADDPGCGMEHPGLKSKLLTAIARYERSPEVLEVSGSEGGPTYSVRIDGDTIFRDAVFMAIIDGYAADIPSLIEAADSGDLEPIAVFTADLNGGPGARSWGSFFSAVCRDEAAFADREQVAAELAEVKADWGVTLGTAEELEECDLWDIDAADARETETVSSSVPTLVLSGSFDPVTPPSSARPATDGLPNSTFVEFPGRGHVFLWERGTCEVSLVSVFLADPDGPLDLDCVPRHTNATWVDIAP